MFLKRIKTLFLFLFILYFNVTETSGCKCKRKSFLKHFCDSDFTMKGKVKSIETDENSLDIRYVIDVFKFYERKSSLNSILDIFVHHKKTGEKNLFNNKTEESTDEKYKGINENIKEKKFEEKIFTTSKKYFSYIYTSKDPYACGKNLTLEKTYIIGGWFEGNQARTSSCHYARQNYAMDSTEKLFFLFVT
jgi:hypothetical protein